MTVDQEPAAARSSHPHRARRVQTERPARSAAAAKPRPRLCGKAVLDSTADSHTRAIARLNFVCSASAPIRSLCWCPSARSAYVRSTTDRLMPGMDGLELCRALRDEQESSYIYILMLTVRDAPEDLVTGFAAGADDYLSKSATEAELVARLHAARRRVALEESLRHSQERMREMTVTLEQRVADRTQQLRALVSELESFSYNVSHHLRAPLRHISAAAHLLLEHEQISRNVSANHRVKGIITASHTLGRLVDDMLTYTRLRDAPMQQQTVAMRSTRAESGRKERWMPARCSISSCRRDDAPSRPPPATGGGERKREVEISPYSPSRPDPSSAAAPARPATCRRRASPGASIPARYRSLPAQSRSARRRYPARAAEPRTPVAG